ncbi:MAG: hypothetical protein WBP03_01455 [Candidatus Saccharimonadales bacterium]
MKWQAEVTFRRFLAANVAALEEQRGTLGFFLLAAVYLTWVYTLFTHGSMRVRIVCGLIVSTLVICAVFLLRTLLVFRAFLRLNEGSRLRQYELSDQYLRVSGSDGEIKLELSKLDFVRLTPTCMAMRYKQARRFGMRTVFFATATECERAEQIIGAKK